MYDVYEFLGRGIIAARSGRSAEAVKYLLIAEKIVPTNVRVWLWLATAMETFAEKRQCLERVLELAPDTLVAKALLERLNQKEISTGQRPTDLVIFTCPSCGGKQRFDPDVLGLVCDYCKHTELLVLADASNAESELGTGLRSDSGNWSILESQVSCNACGARLLVPAEHSTLVCPFCNSDQVVIQSATPGLIPPTAVGPFLIHSDDVRQILRKWWGNSFLLLTPLADISDEAITISPIYLPFWTFDGRVQIRCALDHRVYPAEYSNDDRVIMIEDNLLGSKYWYECDIDDLLVYAARSLKEAEVRQVTPFHLKSLLEYRPAILAGWQAELYQIALEDAAIQAHKQMRDQAFNLAMRRMLFMEPMKMLQDDVRVLDKTYKLILLPVWIIRYTFRNQSYQALVNGQTGKVVGKKPFDWLSIVVVALIVIILALLGWLLTHVSV